LRGLLGGWRRRSTRLLGRFDMGGWVVGLMVSLFGLVVLAK
jgi:hypothetical protein